MKLKCIDGITRAFVVARPDGWRIAQHVYQNGAAEAYCQECGETFGCHDTKILKPRFKAHSCKETGPNA